LLAAIRIVLVEPQGPLNLGAIARVAKNMGLTQLVLVDPHCSPTDPQALQMAVHAAELLHRAEIVSTLPAALVGCRRVAGTAGRSQAYEYFTPSPLGDAFPWLLELEHPCALVFGPEDRGLNNQELAVCQRLVSIPTSADYPSLNLAQAVGICAYELRRCVQMRSLQSNSGVEATNLNPQPPPAEAMAGFYEQLETLLLQIGYLHPHTAPRKMLKFRRLFDRTQLTWAELALLRGVVRQLEWADRHPKAIRSSLSGSVKSGTEEV
jgi:tRNA/rRNA methyltransferase